MAKTIRSEAANLARSAVQAGWSCTFVPLSSTSFAQTLRPSPLAKVVAPDPISITWRRCERRLDPERVAIGRRVATMSEAVGLLTTMGDGERCQSAESMVRRAIGSGWITEVAWTGPRALAMDFRADEKVPAAEVRMVRIEDQWHLCGVRVSAEMLSRGVRCSLHAIQGMIASPAC